MSPQPRPRCPQFSPQQLTGDDDKSIFSINARIAELASPGYGKSSTHYTASISPNPAQGKTGLSQSRQERDRAIFLLRLTPHADDTIII